MTTSKKDARYSSKLLRKGNTVKIRSVAGSDLAQAHHKSRKSRG